PLPNPPPGVPGEGTKRCRPSLDKDVSAFHLAAVESCRERGPVVRDGREEFDPGVPNENRVLTLHTRDRRIPRKRLVFAHGYARSRLGERLAAVVAGAAALVV